MKSSSGCIINNGTAQVCHSGLPQGVKKLGMPKSSLWLGEILRRHIMPKGWQYRQEPEQLYIVKGCSRFR